MIQDSVVLLGDFNDRGLVLQSSSGQSTLPVKHYSSVHNCPCTRVDALTQYAYFLASHQWLIAVDHNRCESTSNAQQSSRPMQAGHVPNKALHHMKSIKVLVLGRN